MSIFKKEEVELILNSEKILLGIFIVLLAVLTLLKLIFASRLDLYSDEVFYWLESNFPALAYSDLPFVTSQLVGLGTEIFGDTPLGVRFGFLILGTIIPALIFWVAYPLTSINLALKSAILCLCLPLAGFLGLLAVPDVPLIFFGLLSFGLFERALRLDRWRYWMSCGFIVAIGFSTHYRFFLYPLSAIFVLFYYPAARKFWRTKKLWSCIGVSSFGLLPVILFNLNNEFQSISFYLINRHPWDFHPNGLLHMPMQAAIVTPPLYFAFLASLLAFLKDIKKRDLNTILILSFSLPHLIIYLLLAPWSDATSTTIHWPLSGYLPLLIGLPVVLNKIKFSLANHLSMRRARQIILLIPGTGLIGTALAILLVGSQSLQNELQPLVGRGVLSTKMAGWNEFSRHTSTIIEENFSGIKPIIATDNYYTAAQLKFNKVSEKIFTLDDNKAIRDGRATQLKIWGNDESAFFKTKNQAMLIIIEDTTLTVMEKQSFISRVCKQASVLNPIGSAVLFGGDKVFSFYRGITSGKNVSEPDVCPYPARVWLDTPKQEEIIDDSILISGWAFAPDMGIEEVKIHIDGNDYGTAYYGLARPDVVSALGAFSDPNAPNLGFEAGLKIKNLTKGPHRLLLTIKGPGEIVTQIPERIFYTQ
ncbi:glycosyltransferase family 39 protein [Gammaproteobacteria bacterium]|nr:glycosyltransferase family 39 protein [Gammaproteobacteria bacterium]